MNDIVYEARLVIERREHDPENEDEPVKVVSSDQLTCSDFLSREQDHEIGRALLLERMGADLTKVMTNHTRQTLREEINDLADRLEGYANPGEPTLKQFAELIRRLGEPR